MKKREAYVGLKKFVADYPEYVEFLDAEIAKLDGRAEKEKAKRAEKRAAADEAIRAGVIEALGAADRPITMAELVAGVDYEGLTPQKVAYYIKPLVDDGTIVKEPAKVGDRKVMTYTLG